MAEPALRVEHKLTAERVARQSDGPFGVISDPMGAAMLLKASLPATEDDFGSSPYLILSCVEEGGGRYRRAGNWGAVEGVIRPGDTLIGLPGSQAEGRTPPARLLGMAIDPEFASMCLKDVGGIDALQVSANQINADQLICTLIRETWHQAETHGFSSIFFDHAIHLILLRLAQHKIAPRREKPVRALSETELSAVTGLIESRLDTNIRVLELADLTKRDTRSFTRAFREATGIAPFEYVTRCRMERAKQLLQSDQSVLSVALDVGYSNPAKFAAAFKKIVGANPSIWRKAVDR